MTLIKEYRCDSVVPTDDEILDGIEMAKDEKCIVKLYWNFVNGVSLFLEITENSSFAECKNKIKSYYDL